MDINLLQCDTQVAVLLQVAVAYSFGELTKMRNKKNTTFFALDFWGIFLQ